MRASGQKGSKCTTVYIDMVITHSSVWINWVRSPILLVVSWREKISISLSSFAPEN